MNIELIEKALKLNLENKANFPQHLKNLIPTGVKKYCVELDRGVVCFYSAGKKGEHSVTLPESHKYFVAPTFERGLLKAALVSVQKGEINYENFLRAIAVAGVTNYIVDISAKKTTYFGNSHSYEEPFPKILCDMLGI